MKNLVLVLALSITGMVAAQNTEKKENVDIIQWYFMSDLNDRGLREGVIQKCTEKLKENGLSILKPGYSEVQVTFIDDKCDIESLLKGECLDFCLDNGDHIKHGWRIDRKGKKWDLVILEIYEYFIKYSVTRVRD